MLTDKQAKLVLQTFYSPLRKGRDSESITVVHDTSLGAIIRVYSENFVVKNLRQQEELSRLPRAGEFTTTSQELADTIEDARLRGILNIPLAATTL